MSVQVRPMCRSSSTATSSPKVRRELVGPSAPAQTTTTCQARSHGPRPVEAHGPRRREEAAERQKEVKGDLSEHDGRQYTKTRSGSPFVGDIRLGSAIELIMLVNAPTTMRAHISAQSVLWWGTALPTSRRAPSRVEAGRRALGTEQDVRKAARDRTVGIRIGALGEKRRSVLCEAGPRSSPVKMSGPVHSMRAPLRPCLITLPTIILHVLLMRLTLLQLTVDSCSSCCRIAI